MSATSDLIQKIYIGYFGRAGDPAGLQYWVERSSAGLSDAAIAQSFSVQPEATAMYGFLAAPSLNMGREEFLNSVYQNLFGRDIDAEGEAYWLGQMNNGRPVGGIILDIINGARNTSAGQDLTVVTNKLAVANYYTEKVITENATWTLADDQADAIAVLAGVTSVSSTVDAGKAVADTLVAADTVPQGSSFTLTTNVDAVSGTAGNDTIQGIIGASGTYTVGDNIAGGSGTDTLNLIDGGSATSAPFVSMSGVEVVNVRMLSAGTTIINANDWDGVETLSNASSVDGSTLNATGVATTTTIKVYDDSDVNVAFSNSTTASSVSLTLVSVGTGNTATSLASASAAATANIDLDLNNSGLLAAVSVSVEGAVNLARLEAGSSVTSYTITGSGNASLVTDDTITSFNATAALGNLDVTFSGASEVTVVGGAGNDTFNLGSTLTNSDSINGGSGTDAVSFTLTGFNRTLSTSNVESITATFSDDAGGVVNATGSTAVTYSLQAGSAGADANVAGVVAGATINLTSNANNLDDVSVGYASGAASGTVNIGSATGAVALDILTVTGVSSLSLKAVAGSAGAAVTIASANFGGAALSITSSGGEADLAITNLTANALQTLTVTSNGSAGVTLTSGLEANTALTSVSVIAQGSDAADVTLGGINHSGSALGFNTLSLTGTGGADIVVGAVEMGNGATAASTGTITMAAGNGSVVGTTAMDVSVTGANTLTLNLSAEASGTVQLGDVMMVAGTASTAAVSAHGIVIAPVTVGSNGLVAIDAIGIGSTAGGTLTLGAVTVGTSAGFVLASGGVIHGHNIDGNATISDVTITLGADASASVGEIEITAGAVGAISLTIADSASASFGEMAASAIGAISVTVSGDGEADFVGLTAASNIGAITLTLTEDADVTIGAISAGGDLGNIIIGNAKSATANFATIGASSIGNITISGAGFVDFGTFSASRVGSIDASAMASGTLNIDLSGVVNAAEIRLGSATNTVISGEGNDVITLLAGRTAVAGNDNIRYTTATQGTDNIINFIAGAAASGGDQIEFGTALNTRIIAGSGLITDATTVVVETATTASGAITIGSAASVVLVAATAFASTAAFHSAVATGGTLEINMVGVGSATAGSLVIVWTDGTDSYVSLVGVEATAGTNALVSGVANIQTVAQLAGVTPGALVAANFDFV